MAERLVVARREIPKCNCDAVIFASVAEAVHSFHWSYVMM
ncbi:hypothetical protein A2U01_0075451, partial [Trifolium medium]|nr:hypothetical protein [Trifolium medium]